MAFRPSESAVSPAVLPVGSAIRVAAVSHVALGIGFGIGTAIAIGVPLRTALVLTGRRNLR